MKQSGITVKTMRKGALYTGFMVFGHANSAPKGEDIVCAAVSALSQTCLHSVQRMVGCTVGISEGLLFCNIHDDYQDETKSRIIQALVGSMMYGLRLTDASYPGYITFEEEVLS